jgi:hypothetical protein
MSKKLFVAILSVWAILTISGITPGWAEDPSQLIVIRGADDSIWKKTCVGNTCTDFTKVPGTFSSPLSIVWDEVIRKYVAWGRAATVRFGGPLSANLGPLTTTGPKCREAPLTRRFRWLQLRCTGRALMEITLAPLMRTRLPRAKAIRIFPAPSTLLPREMDLPSLRQAGYMGRVRQMNLSGSA